MNFEDKCSVFLKRNICGGHKYLCNGYNKWSEKRIDMRNILCWRRKISFFRSDRKWKDSTAPPKYFDKFEFLFSRVVEPKVEEVASVRVKFTFDCATAAAIKFRWCGHVGRNPLQRNHIIWSIRGWRCFLHFCEFNNYWMQSNTYEKMHATTMEN